MGTCIAMRREMGSGDASPTRKPDPLILVLVFLPRETRVVVHRRIFRGKRMTLLTDFLILLLCFCLWTLFF